MGIRLNPIISVWYIVGPLLALIAQTGSTENEIQHCALPSEDLKMNDYTHFTVHGQDTVMNALHLCDDVNAELVALRHVNELNELRKVCFIDSDFWVGFVEDGNKKQYHSVQGDILYENDPVWAPGKPGLSEGPHCVISTLGGLAVEDCQTSHRVICGYRELVLPFLTPDVPVLPSTEIIVIDVPDNITAEPEDTDNITAEPEQPKNSVAKHFKILPFYMLINFML